VSGIHNADRKNIFICHSSQDEEAVRELRIHLNPLFDSGDLVVWEDSMLFSGQPWEPAIRAAMRRSIAAIFLVSAHLLNSKYVRGTEIPAFLKQAHQAKFRIYCLYLDYSVVDEVEFTFRANGAEVTKKLTDFHGLNAPTDPISRHPRSRTEILAIAAKRIFADTRDGRAPKTLYGIVDRPPVARSKTLYVRISRFEKHARYGKRLRRSTILAVHHDEDQIFSVGDSVEIIECRPISRTKHHKVLRKLSDRA
jgi:small subunit ribosomal protein S17